MRIFDKMLEKTEPEHEEAPAQKQNFIREFFRHDRIYIRFLITIMFFSVIPCAVIGFWANYYIKDVVLNRYMEEYLSGIYENVENGVNHYVERIAAYSNYIFSDGVIYAILNDKEKDDILKETEVREYLNTYRNERDLVANVDIVMNDGFVIREMPEYIEDVGDDFRTHIRHTNVLVSSKLVKNENEESYIVFGRSIFSMASNKKIFDIYIYVPEENIYAALSEIESSENLFFLAADNRVISHPDKSSLGGYVLFPDVSFDRKNRQHIGDYFYDYRPIEIKIATTGEWAIESRMSYSWLYKTTEMLRSETMIILLMAVLVSLVLAIVIPISLVKSVSLLKKRMNDFVQNGDSVNDTKYSFKDISDLEQSFNKMVVEINDLMERNNIEKEKQRRAELQALQAQINPHFIYNALDAITWYAKIEKQNYLADMVYELATFFRISLHKGDNLIKVSEEIRHVESYIAIEQLRFPSVFEVEYKIQEDLMDELMLKIVLQPIVENSIKHGFENMDSGGKINITGYCDEDGDIIFEVEDNGHGMDFDPLSAEAKSRGYGIRNVHERIQLEYGPQYGLTFRSIPGEGTLVRIHLKSTKG